MKSIKLQFNDMPPWFNKIRYEELKSRVKELESAISLHEKEKLKSSMMNFDRADQELWAKINLTEVDE